MRQLSGVFGLAAVLVFAAMHDASAVSPNFSWSGINACGRNSPAFTIRDAPKGHCHIRQVYAIFEPIRLGSERHADQRRAWRFLPRLTALIQF
jgi:hypothetical protein